jgi:hypothetical protein
MGDSLVADSPALYLVRLRVANPILLGSPVLELQLAVNAATGAVTGAGDISQSITPQAPRVHVSQITGHIHHTGFGPDKLLVHLIGEYIWSATPPAIGTFVGPFSAALAVSHKWDGTGSFAYGRHEVTHCKVTNEGDKNADVPLIAVTA